MATATPSATRGRSSAASLTTILTALLALVLAGLTAIGRRLPDVPDGAMDAAEAEFATADGIVHQAQVTGRVLQVIVIAVAAVIGILVVAEIETNISMPANSSLDGTLTTVLDGFGGAMGLIGVVLIVLLASVVLGVIMGLTGGNGR